MGDAVKAMCESAFGERIEDMIEISSLVTTPAKQGHGYGTALVKIVHDLVSSLL